MSWAALAAIVIWGFSFIAIKVAVAEVHPFALLTLRSGIGAILLCFIQCYRDRNFWRAFTKRDWVSIVLLATIGITGHNLLQAYGLLFTTAIDTGWIIAVQPLLIAVSAWIFLAEIITPRKMVGIILGFFGVFLIISRGVFSLHLFKLASTFGDLLVLLSAITWTAFTVGGRGFLSRFPPLAAITPIMSVGFLVNLALSSSKGEWNVHFQLSLNSWISIMFLGIFCSGLAYFFWYSALEKKDSSLVGVYLYLEPLVTLIGACFLLGEEIRWLMLVGGGLTLLGVYLATRKI